MYDEILLPFSGKVITFHGGVGTSNFHKVSRSEVVAGGASLSRQPPSGNVMHYV